MSIAAPAPAQETSTHSFLVRRAAVLGAGTMGSRIAAHLANAGIPSLLLDMVPSGERRPEQTGLNGTRRVGQVEACGIL